MDLTTPCHGTCSGVNMNNPDISLLGKNLDSKPGIYPPHSQNPSAGPPLNHEDRSSFGNTMPVWMLSLNMSLHPVRSSISD